MAEPVTLKDVFDGNFIELLRLAPANPCVRALILKLTGKVPAPDCTTFEQVQRWVETTCQKRNRPQGLNLEGGISIDVDFSEVEHGRADYSVRREGSGEYRLGADDLLELIQNVIDEGGDLDKVVAEVADRIDDEAWEHCDPALDDYGDHNYDDHESQEISDSQVTFSRQVLRNTLVAFVRQHQLEDQLT